jgi:hypothetical protein
MKFKDLYNNLLLEFSEGAIKKLIAKFSDTEEQTVRFYLDKFERFKNALEKKDPFQYKTFTELEQAVDAAEGKRNVKKGDQKKVEIDVQQDDIVAEDDNVVIYRGDSQDKCVLYGRGYTFCISRSAGGNMYSNYRLGKESTFYFIYFKKKPVTENDHIMVLDHTKNGYMWTFKNNNTQRVEGGWDEIVSKYPELKPYEKLLVNKKLDDSEKKEIETIKDFTKKPTLEKFKSVDYQTQSKLLKSSINLPDDIFDVLDSYLINDFLSIGPNLTPHQADSLKPNQVQRYIKTREISYDQLDTIYYKFNKHDINVQKIKDRVDAGQKIAYDRVAQGDFNLSNLFIIKLPENIPSSVETIFDCSRNNLTSLEGAPSSVGKDFLCSYNNLTSLKGAPSSVGEDFTCYNNKLISLKGAPSSVGGTFDCSDSNLTSLVGAPSSVGKDFLCTNNNLTSLEGAPITIKRDFSCHRSNLISLEGAPRSIGGNFECSINKLTSLVGAPSSVKVTFVCSDNKLTSLEGAPSSIEGGFYVHNNNLNSLEGAPITIKRDFTCYNNKLISLKGAPSSVGGTFDCGDNKLTSLVGAPSSVGEDFSCNDNNLTSLKGGPITVGGAFYGHNNNLTSLEGAPSNARMFYVFPQKNEVEFSSLDINAAMKESRIKKAKSMLKENRKFTQIELLENLRDWFAPHVDKKGRKFKGWINCKTGGPCGRNDTSKGSYPACRATKAECDKIKGKMYKKKSSKRVSWKKPKKKSE